MSRNTPSIAQLMKDRGYSRREFLYLCGAAAAAAGLSTKDIPRAVRAFEASPRRRVLRIIFPNAIDVPAGWSASCLIANDLICETKCFALGDELTATQAIQLSRRIEASTREQDFLLLVEGTTAKPESVIGPVRLAAQMATSVVAANSDSACDELFGAAAAQLISTQPADGPHDLIDSWETAAARDGFAIYRAKLFGSPENLPRLPYRPSTDSQRDPWTPSQIDSVPPRLSGVALHALTSNVPKHKLIRENIDDETRPYGGRAGADRANFARGGNSPHGLSTRNK